MQALGYFLTGIGLSMDAFAASVSKGLAVQRYTVSQSLCCGAWFGSFQMLMPLAGYLLSMSFARSVHAAAHWIACILLALVGGNMVREAISGGAESVGASFAPRAMLVLAAATAIDALAVGVTFAALETEILPAVCIIGAVTFVISAAGVRLGAVFGQRHAEKAGIFGGMILILLGVKVVLEHYGLL